MNPVVHSKAKSDLNFINLAKQTGIYFKLFVLPWQFCLMNIPAYVLQVLFTLANTYILCNSIKIPDKPFVSVELPVATLWLWHIHQEGPK